MFRLPTWVLGLMRATRAFTGSGLPSILSTASCPARTKAASAALMAASSSSRPRSTISTMRASTGTRSPGCARRCDTMPLIGAFSVVSSSVLRATSAAAAAAWKLLRAPASVAAEVSSAVLEMKPFSINAWLLSNWRCAMSTWALAALAWSSAWRSRAWNSVDSIRAITWPAFTLSPSRTVRPCSSPGTRALTRADDTALSAPVTGRPISSSRT